MSKMDCPQMVSGVEKWHCYDSDESGKCSGELELTLREFRLVG